MTERLLRIAREVFAQRGEAGTPFGCAVTAGKVCAAQAFDAAWTSIRNATGSTPSPSEEAEAYQALADQLPPVPGSPALRHTIIVANAHATTEEVLAAFDRALGKAA